MFNFFRTPHGVLQKFFFLSSLIVFLDLYFSVRGEKSQPNGNTARAVNVIPALFLY